MRRWLISCMLLVSLLLLCTIFYGTPWGKADTSRKAENYLNNKYGNRMTIESIEYNFDNSSYFDYNYYAVVHLNQNPQIKFKVNNYRGEMFDDFYISLFEYNVRSELKNEFKEIDNVLFQLKSNFLEDHSVQEGEEIPEYHQVKQYIQTNDLPEMTIWLKVSDASQKFYMGAILKMVTFLKEKDYRLSAVSFIVEEETGNKRFKLKGSDLMMIHDLESLLTKLK